MHTLEISMPAILASLLCLVSVPLIAQEPKVTIVGRNASKTRPAKILAILVKDKGAPALVPVKQE